MFQGWLRKLLHLLAQHRFSIVAVWLTAAMALVSASDLKEALDLGACPLNQIRRQLQVAYRCKPEEFFTETVCGQVKKVIDCPKGRYLAVHSAWRGRSLPSTNDCSRTEITNDTDCRVHCVVRAVETLCLGKHRCSLSANDDRFGQECPPSATAKPNILRIRYTCVRRAILDELRQNNRTSRVNDQTDYQCPEEGFKTPPLNHRKRGPVTPLPSSSSSSFLDPSSTPIAQESKQTNGLNAMKIREERFSSTHAATSTSPIEADTATPSVKATDSPDGGGGALGIPISAIEPRKPASPSFLLRSISEWVWTWTYVNDNVEKSILYMLCSLCFGIILLLVAATIRLACKSRTPRPTKFDDGAPIRLANSNNSVKWRSPESESSTGDDRTLQGDEDVEATHGGHPHHHHHNHHPRQGYLHVWHREANGPSSPPAADNTESPGALTATDNTALMKFRGVSDGQILPPQQQGTQSLSRRTEPHLWYNQDAGDESPVVVSAQTLQPTRHCSR